MKRLLRQIKPYYAKHEQIAKKALRNGTTISQDPFCYLLNTGI